jgi:hypothetical protein
LAATPAESHIHKSSKIGAPLKPVKAGNQRKTEYTNASEADAKEREKVQFSTFKPFPILGTRQAAMRGSRLGASLSGLALSVCLIFGHDLCDLITALSV